MVLNRFDLKSLRLWGITFALPFPFYWSSSTLLYLSIRSLSWHTLVTGLPVKDSLNPCSLGRLTLKVLMAMSSKSPFISLYISQYLSEYVFKVSPFRMDRDSREFKGLGNFITRDKMGTEGLSELLEGIYGISPQTVKPPHCHKS